jgi:hypothetical protein
VTTQATVEAAEAETSIHDTGRADVEKEKEVVEAPLEAGQSQQDRPAEPAVEVERGVVVPPPIVQAMVPVAEVVAPPEGSTSALIDLTLDDSPTDKGKQVANVEAAEAADQAGTSTVLRVTMPRHWPGGRTLLG